MTTVRLIKHEAIAGCGSYEVRFDDGRSSVFFYFEDLPGCRLRPDVVDSERGLKLARALALSTS